ncbi:MAG: SLC13 family permease [Planctomycetota bacterium]
MWTLPLVLFATFAALVSGKVRIEIVALALVATLGLTGLVEPGEALSGFSSEATIAVASMLVISAALERTGVVGWLARVVGRGAGKSRTGLLVALAIPGVLLSAFMNNTAIVALMIPVALELGRRRDVRPSKLLIPVSYFSILGGTCTLVGTSTNLLVDSLARDSGHAGFGMFEFTGLGLCYVAIGTVYILFVGARTLPDRTGFTDLLAVQSPGRFITEVVLKSGSRHAGKRIGDVFGGRDLRVIEIVRDETPLLAPKGDTQLEVGDVLYVESSAQNLTNLLADPDVERGTAVADDERVPLNELLAGEMFEGANALFMQAAEAAEQGVKAQRVDLRLAEAVITPNRLGLRAARSRSCRGGTASRCSRSAASARSTTRTCARWRCRPATCCSCRASRRRCAPSTRTATSC